MQLTYIPCSYKRLNSRQKETLKRKLIKRDGNFCQVCRCNKALTIEHIIPNAAGGSNDLSNLRLLCYQHNQAGKVKDRRLIELAKRGLLMIEDKEKLVIGDDTPAGKVDMVVDVCEGIQAFSTPDSHKVWYIRNHYLNSLIPNPYHRSNSYYITNSERACAALILQDNLRTLGYKEIDKLVQASQSFLEDNNNVVLYDVMAVRASYRKSPIVQHIYRQTTTIVVTGGEYSSYMTNVEKLDTDNGVTWFEVTASRGQSIHEASLRITSILKSLGVKEMTTTILSSIKEQRKDTKTQETVFVSTLSINIFQGVYPYDLT